MVTKTADKIVVIDWPLCVKFGANDLMEKEEGKNPSN